MIGSAFGMYIMSIVGAVVLMTVADIILPEGQTAKYTKSALSIFLVLIIISPISKIMSGEVDIGSIFKSESVQADYSFTQNLNRIKADSLEKGLEKHLEKNGYKNVKANILYTESAEGITVDFVHIDLTNVVFIKETEHINIIYEVTNISSEYCVVQKERVFTYGAS